MTTFDENHNILACEFTPPEVGDPTAVPDLLGQITTAFETFMGDGAYDGEPVSQAVLNKQPIAQQGRSAWQQKTEAWISASALNRMTSLGMPVSVKI